jgi:hypothetical protein
MARPVDHDQFVFDTVTSHTADTPAASHIADTPIGSLTGPASASAPALPPGLNTAPPDALTHFTDAFGNFPGLPQDGLEHGGAHLPGWLLPGI